MNRRGFLAGVFSFTLASRLPKPKPLPVHEPKLDADVERAWQQVAQDLNEALKGQYVGQLRVESLEATMRVLTFNQSHIKLWKEIPRV